MGHIFIQDSRLACLLDKLSFSDLVRPNGFTEFPKEKTQSPWMSIGNRAPRSSRIKVVFSSAYRRTPLFWIAQERGAKSSRRGRTQDVPVPAAARHAPKMPQDWHCRVITTRRRFRVVPPTQIFRFRNLRFCDRTGS